ncbi:hypothetical protein [Shinella zoogloeoides]|uniref:hypothetical protein n=1 Tax=Shinella zoogloeoides TaxID=352475 RepID=UPI001F5787AB|nr:hypothetical protein [Shinella zoogloeoides]
MAVRIDHLNPTALPSRLHEVPAIRDGVTVKLTISQILELLNTEDISGLSDALETKAEKALIISADGLATGGGDISENRTITVPKANTSQAQGRTSDTVALTPLTGDKLVAARDSLSIHVRDQKTSGMSGGATSSGDNVRTLNTVVTNGIPGASLASNKITLPAGVYEVEISAPAIAVNRHKIDLRDAVSLTYLMNGSSEYSPPGSSATKSIISDRLTLAATTQLEIVHGMQTANAANGFGVEASLSGRPEVYTKAKFWKVD